MLLVLLLLCGVFACATAVIMIKSSTEHALLLAAYRLFVATIVLSPLFFNVLKKQSREYLWKNIKSCILPAISLAFHFITWIIGARMTLAANSSLIVNMMPVAMPFFLYFIIKEKITKIELFGTIIALSGVIILSYNDFHIDITTAAGDILCFISMMFFALYLVLSRRYRKTTNIWLYLVPLYFIAGLFCFILALFFINPIKAYSLNNILYILGLGIIPTVFGHSIINYCMRRMRGQIVTIINLSQFIFAGILAYFLLHEKPSSFFYLASFMAVLGAVIIIQNKKSRT